LNYKVVTDPSELRRLGWHELVESHPDGTVFQSPEMFDLFDRTEKMQPVAIGVCQKEEKVLAGIMLGVIIREMKGVGGYFSSRTVIYGGPLIQPNEKDPDTILDILLKELIKKVKHRSVFIQFRNFRDMSGLKAVFEKNRFRLRDRLNYLVNTTSLGTVEERMGTDKQRQMRKGLKSGAEILPPASEEEMREFYRILFDLYKNKVKKPLPDWSFFREFYKISTEGKLGTIRLVKRNGQVIGGILSPVSPGKTIYEWYVCGLDQKHKEAYPSVLATWAAINYALKNDISTFDFMGVGIPGRSYGVRTFKSRFGGEMVNYGRFARINSRLLYFISEMGYNLLALMKGI
jgi:lipid II:glycine glycyltransferase (peptidoglycan interpeptide bridge formation enzyme)